MVAINKNQMEIVKFLLS
jgi:hypothetical protein